MNYTARHHHINDQIDRTARMTRAVERSLTTQTTARVHPNRISEGLIDTYFGLHAKYWDPAMDKVLMS